MSRRAKAEVRLSCFLFPRCNKVCNRYVTTLLSHNKLKATTGFKGSIAAHARHTDSKTAVAGAPARQA